jgi:hypothetical protein
VRQEKRTEDDSTDHTNSIGWMRDDRTT